MLRLGPKLKIYLGIILFFAFFLRLSYLLEFRQSVFFNASLMTKYDQRTFDNWAGKIVKNPWVGDGKLFYMAPGYPYFVAAIYKGFGHSYFAVGFVQIILDTLLCLLLFFLGKWLFNERVGLLASLFAAFYRPFIFYSATLLSDSLILFLNIFTIFIIYWALKKKDYKRWILAGLVMGLSALAKPTVLLFLPFLLVGLYFIPRRLHPHHPPPHPSHQGRGKQQQFLPLPSREGKTATISSSPIKRREEKKSFLLPPLVGGKKGGGINPFLAWEIVVLLMAIIISPVTIRNYYVSGQFVPICSNGPVNYKIGNSLDSIGLYIAPEKPLAPLFSKVFWKLQGNKFLLFFNSYEWPQNLNIYLLAKITKTLRFPLFGFGLIVPLGIIGLFLALRRRESLPLVLFTLCNILWVILFFITSRYRLPAVGCLMLFAAFFIDWFFFKVKERKYIPVVVTLFISFFLFSFVNNWRGEKIGTVHLETLSFLTHKNVNNDIAEGNFPLALKRAKSLVSLLPSSPLGHELLATIYQRKSFPCQDK